MEDDLPRPRGDAASRLSQESLDTYSQDELVERVALLEAEIARVKAHHARAADRRRLAEALFSPAAGVSGDPAAGVDKRTGETAGERA